MADQVHRCTCGAETTAVDAKESLRLASWLGLDPGTWEFRRCPWCTCVSLVSLRPYVSGGMEVDLSDYIEDLELVVDFAKRHGASVDAALRAVVVAGIRDLEEQATYGTLIFDGRPERETGDQTGDLASDAETPGGSDGSNRAF